MKTEQDHLNHPFYKKVDDVTSIIAHGQILKGAAKYDEPFNPHSWTPKQLVEHQLQELRDAQVYSVGLLELLESQEDEIRRLKEVNEELGLMLKSASLKLQIGRSRF